jgi:hypothetical protein
MDGPYLFWGFDTSGLWDITTLKSFNPPRVIPCRSAYAILPLLDLTVEKSRRDLRSTVSDFITDGSRGLQDFREYCGLPCPSTILDRKVENSPEVPP